MSTLERAFIVLICGDSQAILGGVETDLVQMGELSVVKEIWSEPLSAPSMYVDTLRKVNPDLVVFCLGSYPNQDLAVLSGIPLSDRPKHLVLLRSDGGAEDLIFRSSLQSGAMDLITYPSESDRLSALISRIQSEARKGQRVSGGVTLVLSATGGAGASTLAAGLSHGLAQYLNRKTLLVDLDIQFGTQFLTHDQNPEKGLKEALDHASGMDPAALMGYVSHHHAGFDLIGGLPDQVYLESDIPPERLLTLMQLCARHYEEVVLDLPSHVGNLMSQSLSVASRIILVVRQDLASVKNARKLLDILVGDFETPKDSLSYVINHYSSSYAVQPVDVAKALDIRCLGEVPDEPLVVQSAGSLGIPLATHAPRSKSAKALERITLQLVGGKTKNARESSVLQRLMSFGRRA